MVLDIILTVVSHYFQHGGKKQIIMGRIEGGYRGPDIVSNGLLLYLDAGSPNSYRQNLDTNWRDISGNNNNATFPSSGVTPSYSTSNGGFFSFDGSNDYATLPSGFANFTSGITFEIWTYPTATSSFDVLLRLLGSGADTISFFRHTGGGGNNYFNVNIGGVEITPNQELNLNQWSQRTFTANGTNWFAYNEGMSGATVTTSKLPNNVTRTTNEIGGTSSFSQYDGRIAIIRLYNRALSATEVLQNYNSQKSRFGL